MSKKGATLSHINAMREYKLSEEEINRCITGWKTTVQN